MCQTKPSFKVYIQDCIKRDVSIDAVENCEIVRLEDHHQKVRTQIKADHNEYKETKAGEYSTRNIVFASIEIGKYIHNFEGTTLKHGIFADDTAVDPMGECSFDWNQYSTKIPPEMLLNPNGKMMRFCDLKRDAHDFPEFVFVRPLSGWKPFTGFSCPEYDLDFEVKSIGILEKVEPWTPVVVFDHKEIVAEYRFWIVDEKVSTHSSYSWDENHKFVSPDEETIRFAENAIPYISDRGLNEFVLDVCVLADGSRKVVEINAMSTSGWYPAMDAKKLIEDLKGLFC